MIIERESESSDSSHSEVEESSPSAAEAGASMRSSGERTRTNGQAVAERARRERSNRAKMKFTIGSFGAITRILNIVPKREDLLKVAAAGPIAGFSLGFFLLLLGFILPPSDGIGVVVDASVFHESLLVGGVAKLLLGDVLKEGTPISLNPLVIWAWAGLLINAINSIPAGELDGGRISFAIWGRKHNVVQFQNCRSSFFLAVSVSARLTSASIALLGLSSLFNDVAFYWVVLIFFLQRGPIAPLSEEITEPDNKYVALGVVVLLFGLL
ncbi:putative zinc metalloprotease egy2, chloroplastic, partial [Sarracenia purpurea var. burkii]